MTDRTLIVAALIIGGAIVATAFQTRARYVLSAAGNNIAWRMDTWSGNVDICGATYTPNGPPVVRCGVVIVMPVQAPAPNSSGSGPQPQGPAQSEQPPAGGSQLPGGKEL
jgi:hypothetical protein